MGKTNLEATVLSVNRAGTKCLLVPMDLHNPAEFDEFLRQRISCGWDKEVEIIEGCRKRMDDKTKFLFWIVPAELAESPGTSRFAGHISLQTTAHPPDLELANPDKTVLMISTFFILPEYRRGGLGRAAVQALEERARVEPYGSPACRALALTALSRRYTEDDEWRGFYAERGMEAPDKGSSIEDWYTRMGYVKWKEEPRYRDKLQDGTEIVLLASFLRKELR
ncbi:hypothetical protein QBC33DRAFT_530407 [Phialemonium atrogriseum]|uniref:N-acetyltransferase domain-containing protein n=1 Tax=Phialemonium atrogriseum TaxID=1093897 RepID=A0AAJ0FPF1_9PEZI|nr:uncharacterized protein QBC33DRAFT_530407 [Phialemonium atrogriseum]KAK1770203.1 hypothetical protein QBC33DRAFT_530407 [Phialemonium atrogriseum]